MSFFIFIAFAIILILLALYIVVYIIYPGSGNNEVLSKITSLESKKDILTSDIVQKTLLGSSGSSVMGFFNILDGDKTIKYTNGFIPLLQVENNWYLEIIPSRTEFNDTSAQLRVNTNDAGQIKEEIIELPKIPKQKWMFIAILRDGRRFDVIYNNQIVASQILEFYPVVISSPLAIGNKGLSGSVIHIMVNGTRLTPSETERERLQYIDTNGTVIEADSISLSLPAIKLFTQCPPGLPCDNITKPPNNNLLEWKTPYA